MLTNAPRHYDVRERRHAAVFGTVRLADFSGRAGRPSFARAVVGASRSASRQSHHARTIRAMSPFANEKPQLAASATEEPARGVKNMPVSATRSRDDLGFTPYPIDPEECRLQRSHDGQR